MLMTFQHRRRHNSELNNEYHDLCQGSSVFSGKLGCGEGTRYSFFGADPDTQLKTFLYTTTTELTR